MTTDHEPQQDIIAMLKGEYGSATTSPYDDPLHVSTLWEIAGFRILGDFGMVTGSTVRARNLGAKLVAGLSQNFGGEISGYTKLLRDAREEAVERMSAEARELGANAVIGVSFTTAELFDIAVELLVYGTAVKVAAASGDEHVPGTREVP
jgi:uncharacterized protein YbjQ (UPF0145 family)